MIESGDRVFQTVPIVQRLITPGSYLSSSVFYYFRYANVPVGALVFASVNELPLAADL